MILYALPFAVNSIVTSQSFRFTEFTNCGIFIFRNGLPYSANVMVSRRANDFPCPLMPDTRFIRLFVRSITVGVFPNEPKFLNDIDFRFITYSNSPHKCHESVTLVYLYYQSFRSCRSRPSIV